MSRRRRPPRQRLVTGYYGEPEPTRRGLPWQACDRCGTRCQPTRYALELICSACRWRAVYHREPPR